MNPYAAPALGADRLEEMQARPRTTLVALACAAYVLFYYLMIIVVVVTGNQDSPGLKMTFAIGMLAVIALGLLGLVLALVELLRNRDGRLLPSLALLGNGAGLLFPAFKIVTDIL